MDHQLDATRAALLALDFQNHGVHPQGYWATHGEPDWPAIARPAVDNTARVLAAARRHRVLVVHVGVAWRPGSPEMNLTAPLFARAPDRSVEGTWGSQFYAPVAGPAPDELVVYKRGVSPASLSSSSRGLPATGRSSRPRWWTAAWKGRWVATRTW
jgi:nicotinamidase-related amidase